MLGMAYIRVLEVATFYFMFQLHPVGSVAHIQVCGTTSCMICGAEDLIGVCKEKIAKNAHDLSDDGKFSWEEVECLGACANAPMAQIGKDYYEDLTTARLGEIIDEMAAGGVPVPGPQSGRFAAEPKEGLTTLKDFRSDKNKYNASAQAAIDIGDTIKRIDGTEVPLLTPWIQGSVAVAKPRVAKVTPISAATPKAAPGAKPAGLGEARGGQADDLKLIKGVGPKLEKLLHSLGFFHFDQIANWTAEEIAWVDENLAGFKGRVTRDDWIVQAKVLAT
jgi:NADH-quinone oxidoreductase subunit E